MSAAAAAAAAMSKSSGQRCRWYYNKTDVVNSDRYIVPAFRWQEAVGRPVRVRSWFSALQRKLIIWTMCQLMPPAKRGMMPCWQRLS